MAITEEAKRKISEAMKARWADKGFRDKVKKGRKATASMPTNKPSLHERKASLYSSIPEDEMGLMTPPRTGVGLPRSITVAVADLEVAAELASDLTLNQWPTHELQIPAGWTIDAVTIKEIQ